MLKGPAEKEDATCAARLSRPLNFARARCPVWRDPKNFRAFRESVPVPWRRRPLN
jgi:hypothetical protein